MPHPFLSDAWMEAVREIRDKYKGQGTPFGHTIKMNQVITEVPFGDSTVRTFIDTSAGDVHMELGELAEPDVTITIDYATARAIFVEQNAQAAMQSFMAGKIKVVGDMSKLMMLQATPPDDTAKAVAKEIKAITE